MKKGFVLMETIVVIVVISVALLTIFSSYNKILSKVKKENKYDTSEYIYMTSYIKSYLKDNNCISDAQDINSNITDFYNSNVCEIETKNIFGIEKIYVVTNLNKFGTNNNVKKFDAYMIDYIRKLDVSDKDELIIVEYKRPAKNDDYSEKKEYSNDNTGKVLYETYISSLEW